jgi:hypothetical protein
MLVIGVLLVGGWGRNAVSIGAGCKSNVGRP